MYYSDGQLQAMAYGSNPAASYVGKSDDCCSALSPLQKLLKPATPIPLQMQKSQKSRLPLTSPAKQRICRDLCCSGTPPSPCYEGCCPKAGGCNPFTVSPSGYNPYTVSPTGCNPFAVSPPGFSPFAVSPTVCAAGGMKTVCSTYPVTDGAAAYCYAQDVAGCGGYSGLSPSPMSLQPKSSSVSPSHRVQYSAHQTGSAKPPQQQKKSPLRLTECAGGAASAGSNDCTGRAQQSFTDTSDEPRTPPARAPTALPNAAAGAVPLTKPKIKVKKHLVDPNAKPKLLNIEGALHLAGANPQDLFSSPLWHPLFGR